MKYNYRKNYRYYGFYQKMFNTTKIVIQIKLDNSTGYAEISEIDDIGKLTEKEIELIAVKKISEIESA